MSRRPATKKPQVPIDECLFGPDRRCPSNVWEAVLSSHSAQDRSNHSVSKTQPTKTIDRNIQHSVNDIGSLTDPASKTPKFHHRFDLTGIDDFEEGRWSTEVYRVQHVIAIPELRRLASQGIVDQGSHRAVAWRVLLSYLPAEISQWKEVLLQKRKLYRSLVAELFVKPEHDGNELRGHHGKKQAKAQRQKQYMEKLASMASSSSSMDYSPQKGANQNDAKDEKEETPNLVDEANGEETKEKVNGEKPHKEMASSDPDGNPPSEKEHGSEQEPLCIETADDSEKADKSEPQVLPTNVPSSEGDKVVQTEGTLDNDFAPAHPGSGPKRGITRTASEWIRRNSNIVPGSPQEKKNGETMAGDVDDVRQEEEADDVQNTRGEHSESEKTQDEDVPAQIREEWKRSGRDAMALDTIRRVDTAMNTLLVNDNPQLTSDSNRKKGVAVNDDPLSTDTDSKWFQFFENASLLDEIRKDVVRTHPDLYFFLEPESNLGQRRYAALERILFVWAKLNKGVRYVQGMNEIIGTLYYVLANDFNEEWACEAEADSYFLFNTLMTEMRDVFVPDLDEADTGIQGRISNMTSLLSLHDPEVRCHLVDIGIDPSFYAIRWLTTLLSREFLLPDTIRLWDSMFASTHKDNFMRYVCVTMVMIIRDDLLKGDFSTCLRLLQSYPTTNVDSLLESSRALWIYESQVTLACHKGGISLHQALNTITPPPSIIMAYGLPGGMARRSMNNRHGDEVVSPASAPPRSGFFNRGLFGIRSRGKQR